MKNLPWSENGCPVCCNYQNKCLGEHIRKEHGKEEFQRAVWKAKEAGMSDPRIGEVFGITFRQLEKIITDAYGVNISTLKKIKKIRSWEPKNFKEETGTVWSYKQRGSWATHDGRYRGNWSPYIPRNIILNYSQPGETVLDYFVGGGTTAVEAKLLGRRCIARDINPACVGLTEENLNFNVPVTLIKDYPVYEPEVLVGDARNLSEIKEPIDLICAHPPYAGIINYSSKAEGDLSKLSVEDFLKEMRIVARESYRVLKPAGKCAILIGDTRKQKHVVSIGFQTINVFLAAGFKLKELVIKRQHNCKTTGFWTGKSIKYNFLLLAHEYLPVFEKPAPAPLRIKEAVDYNAAVPALEKPALKQKLDGLETTTVWILPEKDFETYLNENVIARYSNGDRYSIISFISPANSETCFSEKKLKNKGLLFIKSPFLHNNPSQPEIELYLQKIKEIMNREIPTITDGGFIVIQTQDIRIDGYIEPLAQKITGMVTTGNLWLKEIVVIAQKGPDFEAKTSEGCLKINHQYLLIYEVITED